MIISNMPCVYRISENSEPRCSYLSLAKGKVINESIQKMRLPILESYDWSFSGSVNKSMSNSKLYNMLYKYKGALMCVNYYNIGGIIVFRDRMFQFILDGNMPGIATWFEQEQLFGDLECVEAGVVKAPVFTYERMQPLTKFVYTWEDGYPVVITRFGKAVVDDSVDVKELAFTGDYLFMFKEEDIGRSNIIYGATKYKGENRVLLLDRERMSITIK